jgi:membrane-bound lytic murein transglycosylase D
MKLIKSLLFLILIGMIQAVSAQKVAAPMDTVTEPGYLDDYFITASLDSLENMSIFSNSNNDYIRQTENKYNFLPNFVPWYPDSVYYYRMQQLDVSSPFDLVYNNSVKAFIDAYSHRYREGMRRVLGLSQMYFPMYEQILDQYNLPLELKYLSIVESSLRSTAKSRVGASGLWQFMYYTGKMYDLNVTSYVDDRCDPYKATVAAARHFKDLYAIFHDWQLVLAAYNSGAGNVKKAIIRSGGKTDFWSIRPYLPRETRDYVPAFMAVVYVMSHTNEHNLFPEKPRVTFAELDTITVNKPVSLQTISSKLSIPYDDLQFLNPSFRYGFVPACPGSSYALRLPKKYIADYLKNEQDLYADYQLKAYEAPQFVLNDEPEYILKKSTVRVKKGQTISGIAKKYHVSVSELKRWNHLRKSVRTGQYLAIYTRIKNPDWSPPENLAQKNTPQNGEQKEATNNLDGKKTDMALAGNAEENAGTADSLDAANLEPENTASEVKNGTPDAVKSKLAEASKKPASGSSAMKIEKVKKQVANPPKYHKVKSGDNLGAIADKYNVSLTELKSWNKIKKTTIQIGQKLRVNPPFSTVIQTIEVASSDSQAHKSDSIKLDNKDYIYYTVRRDDTLWTIAQKYQGITVQQIKEWNNLTGNNVKVGQRIKLILSGG